MQPEMFVVPDAAADQRFAHNPLVTGDPHIRFYAGTPLATRDGHLLGTLCVIDRQPRTLTKEQKTALEILARQVIANIELRNNLRELKDVLAARDAAESPSGETATGLDELIAELQAIASSCRRFEKFERRCASFLRNSKARASTATPTARSFRFVVVTFTRTREGNVGFIDHY